MASAAPRPRILCIDDQDSGLVIRKLFLESEGYSVLTANSGPAGLQLLRHTQVDALVLDYRMPGMDGEEVAARVRKRKPGLPIIVLSGVPDLPVSLRAQADACVAKGSEPEELLQALAEALGYCPAKRVEARSEFVDQVRDHVGQVRDHVGRSRRHVAQAKAAASETTRRVERRKKRRIA